MREDLQLSEEYSPEPSKQDKKSRSLDLISKKEVKMTILRKISAMLWL